METLIKSVTVFDGTGRDSYEADVLIKNGLIERIIPCSNANFSDEEDDLIRVEGQGLALSPGFIDTHTHDDIKVIDEPELLCKLSQGVTTIIVGNCGASAAYIASNSSSVPNPINLLGSADKFAYPNFDDYKLAVEQASPAVNVAALIGHSTLRQRCVSNLNKTATEDEIHSMRSYLREGLASGALGFSTGLSYDSALAATTDELLSLADELSSFKNTVYATHIRTEADKITEALEEAFHIGRRVKGQTVISHFKCVGAKNWGRADEVIRIFDDASKMQKLNFDCYPYPASSTVLDPKQITSDYPIKITHSTPHPEMSRKTLSDIAALWNVSLEEACYKLQPATAIYFNMNVSDVSKMVTHPSGMIGSDGLPYDPNPHPRLWGTFPRIIHKYCIEEKLMLIQEAIRKMTSLPAACFKLHKRGLIKEKFWADLVLFNPNAISDRATYDDPIQTADGIEAVWTNGQLSYLKDKKCIGRPGRFIIRQD